MILLAVKIFLKETHPQEVYFSNLWLLSHTTLTFLGYAGFTTGFVCAILYLWQEKKIKKHSVDILSLKTVPALQILDNVGYQSIKIGFLFLTGGMIVGAFWLGKLEGVYWSGSLKEIFSVITWFTYAILLHLHIFGFFRGKKIAWIMIAAFALMVFSFIGINLLFPTSFHN